MWVYPVKKLWEVCEVINWWTPDTSIATYWNGEISWITPKDMWQLEWIYVSHTSRNISESWLKNSSAKILPVNSVILSSRAPIGHLAINQVPMCTNQGCKWLIPKENINVNFLFYFLRNSKELLNNLWSGTTFKELSSTKLKEVEIPLPPLSAQQAIVVKLDEAFARIDGGIELIRGNIAELEEMNRSVLEWVLIENAWNMKSVEDISDSVQYWYTGKTTEKWLYKLLRITDIQNNGIIWNEVPFVEITDNEAKKYLLNKWDIVFARTGATVWKSCLIDKRGEGNIFASYLIRIVWKKDVFFPEYMKYFFYSKFYWDQILADVVWAAQPNFNWSKLKNIQIPIPPLSTQHSIVAHLDQVFEKNKNLRAKFEAQIAELQSLKQSLLQDAFEGRLVPE